MFRKTQYNLAKLLDFPFDPQKNNNVRQMGLQIKARGGLKFQIKINEEGWMAECENLEGIITGGTNPRPSPQEIDAQIKDAIFSAFNIPPYLCKDELIRKINEPVKEVVYA